MLNSVMPENRKNFTVREIASLLEREIVEKSLAPGVRLPTNLQLSTRFNVSVKTADRALCHLVDKGIVDRARGRGTFVKSNRPAAQKIRLAYFYWKQGFELAELNQAAYGSFDELLKSTLTEHGFAFDVFEDNPFAKKTSRIFEIPLPKYDVLIAPAGILEVADKLLRNSGIQKILYHDGCVHSGPWHQVVYDYRPGFHAALEYFLKHGRSKFFIACNEAETSQHRMEAILAAAGDLGIFQKNIHIHRGQCPIFNSQIITGSDCANHFLKNGLQDHAIIATGDFIAFGMLDVFAKAGLKPGKDFKLISYDNMESRLDPEKLKLGLSGITHPLEAHAKAIVTLLEGITRTPPTNDFYQTFFVPARELVLRETT